MKYYLLCFLILIACQSVSALELNIVNGSAQMHEAIEEVARKLPAKFHEKLSRVINIKITKPFSLNPNKTRLGQYNDLTHTLVLDPSVFADTNQLQKIFFHEMAHAYEFNVEQIHEDHRYQLISGYHRRGIVLKRLKRGNYLDHASVDTYEFKGIEESVPVNFEAFMLDPEFKCRKPSVYRYFSNYFNHSPFAKDTCEMIDALPVWISGQLSYAQMDFSKLYQVHYLFADKGKEGMSRWGHAMLRLVFCAPSRVVMDEECIKDVQHHWVISFRANVQDIEINNIKGMLGKYPSEMFIFPMLEIIKEYNKTELRDLYSLPLNNTEESLEDFKFRVYELAYSYLNKYRFFSVNCATETLDLIKSFIPNSDILEMDVISPLALFKKLKKSAYTTSEVLRDRQLGIKNGYIFSSQKDLIQSSFEKIVSYTDYSNVDKYLEKTSALQRKDYFVNKLSGPNEWASVLLLENQIYQKYQKDIMENVAKDVVDLLDDKKVPEGVQTLETLRKFYIQTSNLAYSWKGYGVPLKGEIQLEQELLTPVSEEEGKKAQEWIKNTYTKEQKELELILDNINQFKLELKNSLRRTK